MSKPKNGEALPLYLAVTEGSVSAVLVREEDGNQLPVYYVSKTLVGAETRYSCLEKLVFALVMETNKLCPYFEAPTIIIHTNYPMKTIMRKAEFTSRMVKWAVHLSGFDVQYEPQKSIKSQALADFVADFSPTLEPTAEKEAAHRRRTRYVAAAHRRTL